MTRKQFNHAVRAAAAVLNTRKLLVIGSQAVHASTDAPVPAAERSMEADMAVLDADGPESADILDGSIGEMSMFHQTFGYCVRGATSRTTPLPEGWRERLVPYVAPDAGGATAMCLDIHDLWLSKAAAGRKKDREFCAAVAEMGLVDPATLYVRLDGMPLPEPGHKEILRSRIEALAARRAGKTDMSAGAGPHPKE